MAVCVSGSGAVGQFIRLKAFEEAPDREDPPFLRGDSNGDGEVNVSDPVHVLNYLFSGGAEPRCLDSADGDDNGQVNITDAVYLLNYLFSSGRPPPPPFPAVGVDLTPDELRC